MALFGLFRKKEKDKKDDTRGKSPKKIDSDFPEDDDQAQYLKDEPTVSDKIAAVKKNDGPAVIIKQHGDKTEVIHPEGVVKGKDEPAIAPGDKVIIHGQNRPISGVFLGNSLSAIKSNAAKSAADAKTDPAPKETVAAKPAEKKAAPAPAPKAAAPEKPTEKKAAPAAKATSAAKPAEKKAAPAPKAAAPEKPTEKKAAPAAKATSAAKPAEKKAAPAPAPKAVAPEKPTEKKAAPAPAPKAAAPEKPMEKKAAPAAKATSAAKPAEKKAAAPKKFEEKKAAAPTPKKALSESKADEKNAEKSTKYTGRFEIKKAKDGRYVFNLYAPNHVIVATSQAYTTTAAALNGIESIIANAGKAPLEDQCLKNFAPRAYPKWEMYIDKGGQYRFRLNAPNGNCIVHSQGYTTKASCKNGMESIIKCSAKPEIDKSYLKKD